MTLMLNAAREAVAEPSATVITIPELVPTSVSLGLPESCPVCALKVVQEGAFAMEYVIEPPSVSLAVGVKLY
jgi:hypothetical protein